ncbi:flagellin [Sporosarcina sp. Te-1]|uniref:flagellin N-terminal helical domain-containing protein n=1 Tax=Sporosarcina sp. Te-1 TaxID=2818390 RepID=UPI001A9E795A|nr:flagellin [Sporosarcina sp. Te-1]QTD40357.1 flagellin [Sporosarcina sp. Te-1]
MLGKWNATGLNIIRNMTMHNNQVMLSMERLSTGKRINRAADDPAGLAISERMRAQIRGLQVAQRNIQDGISMVQTAEGVLNETHAILQRMRELSVQASNGTLSDKDRKLLDEEFQQLKDEIMRHGKQSEFNTKPILNDSQTIKIQAGANAGQTIDLEIGSLSGLDLDGISIATQDEANEAISKLDKAIDNVSSERSKLGAYVNRLEHAYNNAMTMEENLTAAESRIRDVDIAKEMMALTKANILLQAGQYVLSLHMQQAQSVLQLLKT